VQGLKTSKGITLGSTYRSLGDVLRTTVILSTFRNDHVTGLWTRRPTRSSKGIPISAVYAV